MPPTISARFGSGAKQVVTDKEQVPQLYLFPCKKNHKELYSLSWVKAL